MQEKILILGATFFQIPAIIYAQRRGYYVITSDYIPKNPGHVLADECYFESTTDKISILELCKRLSIDGILCFCSDPAAPTAAYVSEKLSLPGNTYEGICTLGEKDKWRYFLEKNNFNVPFYKVYSSFLELDRNEWILPVVVKPVDSSGSKGVTKVNYIDEFENAFSYAMSFSRSKKVIVEEFIHRKGPQIGGDGFYGENKIEFICYGDQIVDDTINGFVPCGMTFPSLISDKLRNNIRKEIERAITLAGLKNLSFNLEVMLDVDDNIYLMELGPRNGGNFIPEVIFNYTGVNLVELAVEAALGRKINIAERRSEHLFAYYALHSGRSGIYKGFHLLDTFTGILNNSYIFLKEGDFVGEFHGSNNTIGILLLEFMERKEMDLFFNNPNSYINLQIE